MIIMLLISMQLGSDANELSFDSFKRKQKKIVQLASLLTNGYSYTLNGYFLLRKHKHTYISRRIEM